MLFGTFGQLVSGLLGLRLRLDELGDGDLPLSCMPGSKTRKIPYPTKNPFTWLFLLVSCPNYTYEVRDCLLPKFKVLLEVKCSNGL